MINAGDTAFVLISTALVGLMTPGLAFFYGGLVHKKNVLTMMMQSFIAMGVVTVLWSVLTFSLSFGHDIGGVVGGLDYLFMRGVGMAPSATYGVDIPFAAFFVFQMMFAIITPALMTGAFADRMNFKSYVTFLALWSVFIYAPLAHMTWGGGLISKLGAIDFAGGLVVHVSAGMGALASLAILGKRKGSVPAAHNVPFVALGVGLLWFGWYGFNAGSALGATEQAAMAFMNTQIAAAVTMCTWLCLSVLVDRKASVVGALTGAVAGLVAITPAAGYVEPWAALVIGLLAGAACFSAVKFKTYMQWDDALDVWGCHGVGGITGSVLTGVFAAKGIGGFSGLLEGNTSLFIANLQATGIAMVLGFAGTFVLLKALGLVMDLGVETHKLQHIDLHLHGEDAYGEEVSASAFPFPAMHLPKTVEVRETVKI